MSRDSSEGFVLAFHCVPAWVEPAIGMFWSALARALRAHGQTLVLVSTVPLTDPELPVVSIPYLLTEFPVDAGTLAGTPDTELIDEIGAWFGCPPDEAMTAAQSACALFQDLLDTFEPSGVIGWQSMNPASRLLRQLARQRDIPCWMAERGWIRGTLMLDLCENNFLSELNLSLPLKRLAEAHRHDEQAFAAQARRLTENSCRSRYASPEFCPREEFRARHHIPTDVRVFVLMTHGEPHLNALPRGRIRANHSTSRERLQADVDNLAHALARQGKWLLVQEHPFNDAAGAALVLPQLPNVLRVTASVDTLIECADCMLFTLSTVQFDAALAGKPFGLLSRGPLSLASGPPQRADHASTEAFLASIEDADAWPARRLIIDRRLAFLLDHVLLSIDDEAARIDSAQRAADLLGPLTAYPPADLDQRFSQFIERWQSPAPQGN